MIDYLIIGQGLAGSLLAYRLLNAKQRIHIIAENTASSSTAISSGIINPIKGIHFTLDDQFETFFDHAQKTYQDIEHIIGKSFFHQQSITRIFNDSHAVKQYQKHNYTHKWLQQNAKNKFKPFIHDPFGSITMNKAAICDTNMFLNKIRHHFLQQDVLSNELFSYDDLTVHQGCVEYKKIKSKRIIFCEGAYVKNNPFFNTLPWHFTKGDIITIKTTAPLENIAPIKTSVWIIPLGENTYSIGATYERNASNINPTSEARALLENKLATSTEFDYTVINHVAGIRPITQDRKPILGAHPEHPHFYIFNGLASNGWLWAPTYASMLCQHLTCQKSLPSTIAAKRFQ